MTTKIKPQDAFDLDEDNPPWPPPDAKPGDVWGAYRLDSNGWWRLALPEAERARKTEQERGAG